MSWLELLFYGIATGAAMLALELKYRKERHEMAGEEREAPGEEREAPSASPIPCPFCGCPTCEVLHARSTGYLPKDRFPFVRCVGCGAESCVCETLEAAIAAWNRRAADSRILAANERAAALQAALKSLCDWCEACDADLDSWQIADAISKARKAMKAGTAQPRPPAPEKGADDER